MSQIFDKTISLFLAVYPKTVLFEPRRRLYSRETILFLLTLLKIFTEHTMCSYICERKTVL